MKLSLVASRCKGAFKGGGRALPMAHVAFRTSPVAVGTQTSKHSVSQFPATQ